MEEGLIKSSKENSVVMSSLMLLMDAICKAPSKPSEEAKETASVYDDTDI